MRLLSLLALLALTPLASAQVRQGQLELNGSASFVSYDGRTVLTLEPTVGYFFTDALEAGVVLNYVSFEGGADGGSIGPFLAYHLGNRASTVRPFARVRIAAGFAGNSNILVGGAVGVKYFFLPGGALVGQAFVLSGGGGEQVGASGGVAIFL